MPETPAADRLRAWLWLNGAFSTVCASILLPFGDRFHLAIGHTDPEQPARIAVGLLAFSVILFLTAVRSRTPLAAVWVIVVFDFAWVVNSVAALVWPAETLSAAGAIGIAVVALIVGVLGVLQLRSGLVVRRERRAATATSHRGPVQEG